MSPTSALDWARARTARARPVRSASEVEVDDRGVSLRGDDAVLDVHFDGRRVFSFRLHRDGVREGGRWLVAWPGAIRAFLHGTSEISVVETDSGREVFRREVSLGDGTGRIAIARPRTGQLLTLDKGWRRVTTFDTRGAEHIAPLMDAIETVVGQLREAGVEPFLAYGTLLGAVREAQLLGHDSDADLGYVSHHVHPVDVIGESIRLERDLRSRGYQTMRYSALAFKVDVDEGDGVIRGLDVFGGFLMDDHLHLMGEIRVPYERSWIWPLTEVVLEGRTLPAPADPERMLAVTYGEGWRVPDPAFHFTTPESTSRRLDGWFRGLRTGLSAWDRVYSQHERRLPGPSELVQWVVEREPAATSYLDVGCGRGGDVLWLARRGLDALGLDFQARAFAKADGKQVPGARFWKLNLLEMRQVLVVGALAARRPGPQVVVARHLVDALPREGRDGLWRLARMALTAEGGGRLYLEFLVRSGTDGYAAQQRVRRRGVRQVVSEVEAAGGRVVSRERVAVSDEPGASIVCRLAVEWEVA